jgi:hypothetical protein
VGRRRRGRRSFYLASSRFAGIRRGFFVDLLRSRPTINGSQRLVIIGASSSVLRKLRPIGRKLTLHALQSPRLVAPISTETNDLAAGSNAWFQASNVVFWVTRQHGCWRDSWCLVIS